MFSQYSWGDFIKFVVALAIPYYAFVAWKYYREDIRDWISNRGQNKTPEPAVEEEEDEDDSALFPVNHYDSLQSVSSPNQVTTEAKLKPGEWLPPVESKVPDQPSNLPFPAAEPLQQDVEIQGPAVTDQTDEHFGVPVLIEVDNPQELSLDVIISAAGRIAPDEKGVLEAVDASDDQAVRGCRCV